jgi:hypothetical protein
MSTNTIASPRSQEQFNATVAEFLIEWKALSREEKDAPGVLHDLAQCFMDASQARTCPDWCDKTEHRDVDPVSYWGTGLCDSLNYHSRHFGNSRAMGNNDAPSGVTVVVYVLSDGTINEGPQVHVEDHDQPTVEQALALASAISEAADFMESLAKA